MGDPVCFEWVTPFVFLLFPVISAGLSIKQESESESERKVDVK
jgi:hypothetical protein